MTTSFSLLETVFKGFCKLEKWAATGVDFAMMVLRTSDSVAGLLYDATNDRVLLVRQQRAAMVREDNQDGFITELVAGRFDVNLGPKALLVKEAKEEAGVTITEDDVQLLNNGAPMALSAGVLTERAFLAFAEIHPDKIAEGDEGYGVGSEGENIGRVWMSAEEFIRATHECVRVLAAAQHLEILRLKAKIGPLTEQCDRLRRHGSWLR